MLGVATLEPLLSLQSLCRIDPLLLALEATSLGLFPSLHGSARLGLALLVLDMVESELSLLVRGVS